MIDLVGKIALITGGSRGQGEAESELLAKMGATVIIGDILDEPGTKLAAKIGNNSIYSHLDVTDPSSWENTFNIISSNFGKLDILVNNAGILKMLPIEYMDFEIYEQVIKVNQNGCWLGMKSMLPLLKVSGTSSIINISSVGGLQGIASASAYVASKYAVRGLTKVAAAPANKAGIA